MTAQRTSNKQILEAIESQTQAITALVGALSGNTVAQAPIPVLEAAEPVQNETATPKVKVPEQYLNHMASKVQARADTEGEGYVMYARHNLAGETKLAYCKASKWTGLKDKGLIGAVKAITPA